MDHYEFYCLDSGAKIDYILARLGRARALFQFIYDNIELYIGMLDDSYIEDIGNRLSEIGIMAETCKFEGLYESVNDTVAELEKIVVTASINSKAN